MRKIELFASDEQDRLKYRVNKFIAEHNVVDIQFQMSCGHYNHMNYAVIVIYEDTVDEVTMPIVTDFNEIINAKR